MPQNATLSVFVFVPGAGHSSACYAAVRAGLAAHGHETVGVELPSVGAGPVQRDLSADVAAVRGAVAPLVAAGREVVVVMHSYGGIPGSDALKGLGRGEGGAPLGGVVGLVYLMSFLIEEGVRVCGERGDVSGFRPYHQLDLEAGTFTIPPETAAEIFFNDLPAAEAERWAAEVQPHSMSVFWSETSYAAWKHIPSTYVVCERDQALPVAFAEGMVARAQRLLGADGGQRIRVRRVDAGHFVMVSRPEWVMAVLREVAGGGRVKEKEEQEGGKR